MLCTATYAFAGMFVRARIDEAGADAYPQQGVSRTPRDAAVLIVLFKVGI